MLFNLTTALFTGTLILNVFFLIGHGLRKLTLAIYRKLDGDTSFRNLPIGLKQFSAWRVNLAYRLRDHNLLTLAILALVTIPNILISRSWSMGTIMCAIVLGQIVLMVLNKRLYPNL